MPATYVLSDDKRYKWTNPSITVECIVTQALPYPGATSSIVYHEETLLSSVDPQIVPVNPPKPRPKIGYGGMSATTVNATVATGSSAYFQLDASESTPGDDPGPAIVQYVWTVNGSTIGTGQELSYNVSQSTTFTLTVTDEIGQTASASATINLSANLPACPGGITPDIGGCPNNDPDGTPPPDAGVPGTSIDVPPDYDPDEGPAAHTVCYFTDWFFWNGWSWIPDGTTIDFCDIEYY